MFTGIVQAVGRIVRTNPLEVECADLDLADVAVGDSICVQGVCLTVTAPARSISKSRSPWATASAGISSPGMSTGWAR